MNKILLSEDERLHALRHSCAHVMAAAIEELFPGAKFGVGPTTDNGFFYDVTTPEPIREADLATIEQKMKGLQKKKLDIELRELAIDDAVELFKAKEQPYKLELLDLLKHKGSTAVAAETGDPSAVGETETASGVEIVSLYKVGEFEDLCRGPHVENSKAVGYFKLTSIAGAYWRGDEANDQLQRIYGVCYKTKDELKAELERLEEVKQRDHRVLGKKHHLFHLDPEVGRGLPLWTPNGTVLRDELEYLAKEYERRDGYQRVATPHLANEKLYYTSGHLPYYAEDMYAPISIGNENYYLKPMNCPHHHQIYAADQWSYRDLPLRLAEYGQVYRYEDSGSLSGIIRARGFDQNDAHIYCRADQAMEEFIAVMNLHADYYRLFDIEDFFMRLSLPDFENLDKYIDDPAAWRRALDIIVEAMEASGLPYVEADGEAAFYGPKIDFIIKSAIGTEYAISTNQLDFLAAERFNLTYRDSDGTEKPVYVIHRAPLGSHERFIAFLIEHYKATFPFWLAPTQIRVLPVSDEAAAYAHQVADQTRSVRVHNGSTGLRIDVDDADTRINKKVREAAVARIPFSWVVGKAEAETNTVSIRDRDGEELGQFPVQAAIDAAVQLAESRGDIQNMDLQTA